jgi:streptogramin lyase
MTDSDLERRLERMFALYPQSPVDTNVAWRRFIRLRRHAAIQRRVITAGVTAAVVTAAAVGAAFAGKGNSTGPSVGSHPRHPAHVGRLAITARIAVPGAGGLPGDEGMAGVMVGQSGQVWAITNSDQIIRIDPATNHVTLRTQIPGLTDMTSGAGAIWVLTTGTNGHLSKVDPLTGRTVATFLLPRRCQQVSYAGKQLWVTCGSNAMTFLRLDLVTGRVLARTGKIYGVIDVAASPDGIWYVGNSGVAGFIGSGTRLRWVHVNDSAYPVSFSDTNSFVYAAGSLWALTNDESVARIDPANGKIIRIYGYQDYDPRESLGLDFMTVGLGSFWFLEDNGRSAVSVLRASIATGRPQASGSARGTCGQPCGQIYLADGSIWVPTEKFIVRIDPARWERRGR